MSQGAVVVNGLSFSAPFRNSVTGFEYPELHSNQLGRLCKPRRHFYEGELQKKTKEESLNKHLFSVPGLELGALSTAGESSTY